MILTIQFMGNTFFVVPLALEVLTISVETDAYICMFSEKRAALHF